MPTNQPWTLYTLAKDFQTLFGTLVGFGGVCLTLWFNAKQAEKKRADEIKHDATTTRIALRSELSVMRKSLSEWKEVFDELDTTGEVALPRAFEPDGVSRAYRAALSKIGLLAEQEIQYTVSAYAQYELLSKMSRDMEKHFDPEKPDEAMKLALLSYKLAVTNTVKAANEALAELLPDDGH